MAATYSLTLRSDLNRKLTIEEMDNNFLYLDNKSGGTTASATLPIITGLGNGITASYNQGSNFLGLGVTGAGQVFDTGSGGFNVIASTDLTPYGLFKDTTVMGYVTADGSGIQSTVTAIHIDDDNSIVKMSAKGATYTSSISVYIGTTTSGVGFEFENGAYTFPTTDPSPGEVLGYESTHRLGWVSGGVTGSYLPLDGGTMNPSASIYFGNGGQNISQGSFDNGLGGSKGIALNCAIDYELNWQAGHLSSYYAGTYSSIIFDSDIHLDGQSEISMGSTFSPSFMVGVDLVDSVYLKLKTGNEGAGKVLTSDSNGFVSWVDIQPYKKYVALLTQSGTASPTATVMEDSLTYGNCEWLYSGVGNYLFSSGPFDLFPVNKTVIFLNAPYYYQRSVTAYRSGINAIVLFSTLNGVEANDNLEGTVSIEIRVYN